MALVNHSTSSIGAPVDAGYNWSIAPGWSLTEGNLLIILGSLSVVPGVTAGPMSGGSGSEFSTFFKNVDAYNAAVIWSKVVEAGDVGATFTLQNLAGGTRSSQFYVLEFSGGLSPNRVEGIAVTNTGGTTATLGPLTPTAADEAIVTILRGNGTLGSPKTLTGVTLLESDVQFILGGMVSADTSPITAEYGWPTSRYHQAVAARFAVSGGGGAPPVPQSVGESVGLLLE